MKRIITAILLMAISLTTMPLLAQSQVSKRVIKQAQKKAPLIVVMSADHVGTAQQAFTDAGVSGTFNYTVNEGHYLHPIRQRLDGATSIAELKPFSISEEESLTVRQVVVNTSTSLSDIQQLPFVYNAYYDEVCTTQSFIDYSEPVPYLDDEKPDPLVGLQEGLTMHKFIEAQNFAKDKGYTYQGERLGVLGTGITQDNKDFESLIIGCFDFTEQGACNDPHGHETTISSIAIAAKNGFGMEGAIPNIKAIDCKVLGESGAGFSNDVVDGGIKAINEGCGTINGSLAPFSHPHNKPLLDYAIKENVNLVFAAGNSGKPISPNAIANNPHVLGVAAIDKDFNQAGFSNYSDETVHAFGVRVLGVSIQSPNHYHKVNGTSPATPFVSALVVFVRDYIKWYGLANNVTVNYSYLDVNDFVRHGCDTMQTARGEVRPINALKTIKLVDAWLNDNYGDTEPLLTLVPIEPNNLSLRHSLTGETMLNIATDGYTATYPFSNYNDAYTAYTHYNFTDVSVYVDTTRNEIIAANATGELKPIQMQLLKLVDSKGADGLVDDLNAEFGGCILFVLITDRINAVLSNRGDELKPIFRVSLKWFARVFAKIVDELDCENVVDSATMSATEIGVYNDIVNRLNIK